jgi:hypothetical protein
LKGEAALSPNGLFHRYNTHANISQTDKKSLPYLLSGESVQPFNPNSSKAFTISSLKDFTIPITNHPSP